MKRLGRILTQLPLATLFGAGLGLLIALIAAVLSATPLRLTVHPLAPFALAPLPAILGAWIDWARLWQPSPRTGALSFALFSATGVAALGASIADAGLAGLLVAAAVPLAAALLAGLGAHALLLLARRGLRVGGFELACGTIREDSVDRLVVDTGDGALEVSREASTDLGPRRALDLSVGATIALLARVRDAVRKADPFRTERRTEARIVLAVAASPRDLATTVRRRARAWVGYALLLALGATAFTATATYQPSLSCASAAIKTLGA